MTREPPAGRLGSEPSPWAMPATALTNVRGKQMLSVGHVMATESGVVERSGDAQC